MIRKAANCAIGLGCLAASAVIGPALASDGLSNVAPRCQVDELRAQPASDEACSGPFAVLGLTGPTVMAGTTIDVETTGSISEPRMKPERAPSARSQ